MKHEFHIILDDETFDRLTSAAEERGMKKTEYVKDILARQSGVELSIQFADIDKYAMDIERLVNTICGLAPILWNSGKAFEQDIAAIYRSVQEINRICNDTWRYVVDTRTQLYDETRAKLYRSVKQNHYSRRRKFVTDTDDGKRQTDSEKEDSHAGIEKQSI